LCSIEAQPRNRSVRIFGPAPIPYTGRAEAHPQIAWAKLKALADGAQLATKQLWP